MCGRRSTTSTRLSSCVATRSAIVRPKNPEPTTKRSKRAPVARGGGPTREASGTTGESVELIGSKGIRQRWWAPNPRNAQGCDRLTIPYHHFSPSSHISTVDLVASCRSGQTHVPDVIQILRRLPCRTDVDAGFQQP